MQIKINMKLGSGLNGVIFTFGPNSNQEISPVLHGFMSSLVSQDMTNILTGATHKLITLHISSTSEPYHAHKVGGPHRNGLAIDISSINGKGITALYDYDEELRGICDALQVKAIDNDHVFENFGPLICFKTDRKGNINQIKKDKSLLAMHKTHLHFSVRG